MLKEKSLDEQVNDNDGVALFIDEIMATTIPSHVKVPTMKYHGTFDYNDNLMAF